MLQKLWATFLEKGFAFIYGKLANFFITLFKKVKLKRSVKKKVKEIKNVKDTKERASRMRDLLNDI